MYSCFHVNSLFNLWLCTKHHLFFNKMAKTSRLFNTWVVWSERKTLTSSRTVLQTAHVLLPPRWWCNCASNFPKNFQEPSSAASSRALKVWVNTTCNVDPVPSQTPSLVQNSDFFIVVTSHWMIFEPYLPTKCLHRCCTMCAIGSWEQNDSTSWVIFSYTPIAFNERVTFWLQPPSHCLVSVRLLHCMRVRLHNGYTRAYAQIMQHTHTHKVVADELKPKSYSLVEGNQTRGCHLSHYVVITDQNFAVKGCPFQHRPRPARDVKRVSILLFFEKRVHFL